jgi:hypothetical protein
MPCSASIAARISRGEGPALGPAVPGAASSSMAFTTSPAMEAMT